MVKKGKIMITKFNKYMMINEDSNLITYTGTIHFDPVNKTTKHNKQASWKRVAMIMFEGEITEYYSWFIEKKYGLKLNKPLRGSHCTFINDSLNDMKKGLGTEDEDEIEEVWNRVKEKYDGKEIDVTFNTEIMSNGKHYWLIVDHAHRQGIHDIRAELGLGKPYFGLHLSIGYAKEKEEEQSGYIAGYLKNEKPLF